MKWLLIIPAAVVGILLLLWFGAKVYFALIGNASVTEELRHDPTGERATRVMLLTFPDGTEFPVNYLREGDRVFVGADGGWWREFRDGNVPVKLFIKGEEHTGRARTVLDDPGYTQDVFTRLRPTAPNWLPGWLNAYLVVIDLD